MNNIDDNSLIEILSNENIYNRDNMVIYVLVNKQFNRICKNYFYSVSKHKGLYVDHCHVTNKVSGLLCSKCNTFIGLAKDDVLILKSAIDYLLSL